MKIMSFNTLHCMDYPNMKIDPQVTANAILTCGADIVGLNEMRGEGEHRDYTAQTEKLSELTGIENYYFARAIELKAGPYGNAMLSKLPIKCAETVPVPDPRPDMMLKHGFTDDVIDRQTRIQGRIRILEYDLHLRAVFVHLGTA